MLIPRTEKRCFFFYQMLLVITKRHAREYIKAKLELQQIVEDFYQQFTLKYLQLRLKHRKQLERFKMNETRNGKVLKHLNGTWA